jgi:glutamyl-tRNA synthetase
MEMAELSEFYFCERIVYDEKAGEKFLKSESVPILQQSTEAFSKETILDKGSVHHHIQQLAETRGEPLIKIAQPIRVALTGKAVSPPIDEVVEILGKSTVIQRLQKAIEFIEHKECSKRSNCKF